MRKKKYPLQMKISNTLQEYYKLELNLAAGNAEQRKLSDLSAELYEEVKKRGFKKELMLRLCPGIVYTNAMNGKYKPIEDYPSLYNIAKKSHETYEYIYGDRPCRFYIDLDKKFPSFSPENAGKYAETILKIKELINNYCNNEFELEFYLLEAHCSKGLIFSAHIIIDFKNGTNYFHCKNVSQIVLFLNESKLLLNIPEIDLKVYNKAGGLFRCIHSKKKQENRKFKLNNAFFNTSLREDKTFIHQINAESSEISFEKYKVEDSINFIANANKIKYEKQNLELSESRVSEIRNLIPSKNEIVPILNETLNMHETVKNSNKTIKNILENILFRIFKHDEITRTNGVKSSPHKLILNFKSKVCVNNKIHRSNNSYLSVNLKKIIIKCLDSECDNLVKYYESGKYVEKKEMKILFSGAEASATIGLIADSGAEFLREFDEDPYFVEKSDLGYEFAGSGIKEKYENYKTIIPFDIIPCYVLSKEKAILKSKLSETEIPLPNYRDSQVHNLIVQNVTNNVNIFVEDENKQNLKQLQEKFLMIQLENAKLNVIFHDFIESLGSVDFVFLIYELIKPRNLAYSYDGVYIYDKKKKLWSYAGELFILKRKMISVVKVFLKATKEKIQIKERAFFSNLFLSKIKNAIILNTMTELLIEMVKADKSKFKIFDDANGIAFLDCFYDFTTNSFANHKRKNYLTKTLKIKKPTNINGECERFLKNIFSEEEEEEKYFYWLCKMALSKNYTEVFSAFWLGAGSNGKTMLAKFFFTCFSNYVAYGSSAMFARELDTMNKPISYLKTMSGKKVIIISEPTEEAFRNAIFKRFNSNDYFTFRVPYGSVDLTLNLNVSFFILTNFFPTFTQNDDKAVWRRIKIFKFSRYFTDEIKNPNDVKAEHGLDYKFKTIEWQETLIHKILFAEYIVPPTGFETEKLKQFSRSNPFLMFLKKRIVKVTHNTTLEYISSQEIIAEYYKEFEDENLPGKEVALNAQIVSFFRKDFGVEKKVNKNFNGIRKRVWGGFTLIDENN